MERNIALCIAVFWQQWTLLQNGEEWDSQCLPEHGCVRPARWTAIGRPVLVIWKTSCSVGGLGLVSWICLLHLQISPQALSSSKDTELRTWYSCYLLSCPWTVWQLCPGKSESQSPRALHRAEALVAANKLPLSQWEFSVEILWHPFSHLVSFPYMTAGVSEKNP